MNETVPPMRVLVVDDNPDDRQLVKRELEALFPQASIVEPGDATELGAAIDAAVPDLVVTDLDVRWSNGGAVLSMVKQRYPNCPVVMFTGTGDEMIAVQLMKAGLDDYVVKSSRQLPRLRASLKLAVEMARSRSALSKRESELLAMVAQRDVIVRELHHRVKNNLQTMISLLQVRSRQVDPATRALFDEIAGRMNALGLVQSRIYEVGALDHVDFSAALSDILETLVGVYDNAELERDFDGPLHLDVSRAMPLALLCYEVILNALKHAWPGSDANPGVRTGRGRFAVQVRARLPLPTLRFEDDGVGFTEADAVKGLGTRLARSLAEEAQVQAETMSTPGAGTIVTLTLA